MDSYYLRCSVYISVGYNDPRVVYYNLRVVYYNLRVVYYDPCVGYYDPCVGYDPQQSFIHPCSPVDLLRNVNECVPSPCTWRTRLVYTPTDSQCRLVWVR